jgi:predicted Zn-dependent protease
MITFLPRCGRACRLSLLIALAWAGVRCTAEDDDFLTPSPFVQATAAFEQGDVARAEVLARPLAEGDAATAEACALLGQVRQRQKRPAEAVTQFERAVAKRPASAQLRSLLGLALLDQAEDAMGEVRTTFLQRAKAALTQAASMDGGCCDAQMGLMRYHLMDPAEGPAGAADRHAEAAGTLDPLSASYEIGELAEKHGRFDLAERYYGVIADLIPANPWLRFKHSQMLVRLGRVLEARKEIDGVLQAFPGFGPAQQLLAELPAQ